MALTVLNNVIVKMARLVIIPPELVTAQKDGPELIVPRECVHRTSMVTGVKRLVSVMPTILNFVTRGTVDASVKLDGHQITVTDHVLSKFS